MNLDKLYVNGLISTRGMNLCRANNLLNLKDIKAYYKRRNTFVGLHSCGQQLNNELIALCGWKYGNVKKVEVVLPSWPLQVSIEELAEIYKHTKTRFSRRSMLVCRVNNLFTTGDIINHFERFGTFTNLIKTGKQTTAELISICHTYQTILEEHSNER